MCKCHAPTCAELVRLLFVSFENVLETFEDCDINFVVVIVLRLFALLVLHEFVSTTTSR